MKTLIIIPARNEEEQLGKVLDRIAENYPQLPVLVVNDASTDATSRVAALRTNVRLIDLPFWMGYGGALQTAYKFALREGFDAIVQIDGDGQHDPVSIARLLGGLEHADLVVGSRFLERANLYSMPFVRRLGCRVLSWLAKRLTGLTITDPTSGFQALNRKALSVAVEDHYPLDYPDVDVLILMHRFHLRVIEIPVIMYPSTQQHQMHEGRQIWYYGLKMLLSVFVMMVRKA